MPAKQVTHPPTKHKLVGKTICVQDGISFFTGKILAARYEPCWKDTALLILGTYENADANTQPTKLASWLKGANGALS